ncbi:nitroreductase/quinone reductase family protein [Streptomyces sp. NPDC048172]|uniref:nitroreductase/quinone reductase family protein n=1 Tax=Streptomyces sp. NPDC048172 TaxID=3365505 RepID=UPI0037111F62
MPNDFNQHVIDEFRANEGRVGGPFEGARLLLLTTTGARSGAPRTTPLGYLADGGGRVLVIASAAGAPHHPAWFHNLRAHPRANVETGAFTYEATATVLEGEERDAAFARAVETDEGWAAYQAKTDRVIPVVALDPVPGPPNPNADDFGEALRVVHNAFRRELALIRDEIIAAGPSPALGAQLRINCLTLCQGLHNHHTGESMGLFPALLDADPALEPTVQRLNEEHEKLAALLEELQNLLRADGTDPARLLPEVDRITEELETHLRYEEEQLIPVLQAAAR